MLRTLDRYVIREVLPPMFLSLLIFTFILEIPPVMDQLEQLVAKGVPWLTAGRMLLTLLPQALGLTIPMSLLVGLLIGLGRMSGDREAVALLACGVSPYRLLRPVLLLAAVAGARPPLGDALGHPRREPDLPPAHLRRGLAAGRDRRPAAGLLHELPEPGPLHPGRACPAAAAGRTCWSPTPRKPDSTVLYMARRGRLILDRDKQTVDLVLEDGTRYSNRGADGKQVETFRFPQQLIVHLDPKTVFSRFELVRGMNELTIPQLQAQAADKTKNGLPAHQEMEAIQQRFSFPAACLVFAIIGVALGLTVARDGKLAGFVVGIAVIFAYYIFLYLAQSVTKGYYSGPDGGAKPLLAGAALALDAEHRPLPLRRAGPDLARALGRGTAAVPQPGQADRGGDRAG